MNKNEYIQEIPNQIEIDLPRDAKLGDRILIKFKGEEVALFIACRKPLFSTEEVYFKQA
jgi:hypothetical protein